MTSPNPLDIIPEGEFVNSIDAVWILTATTIIFTMQTGFALLESGCCTKKNEANIMMKNVVDVLFGGLAYWALGFGFQYGLGPNTNPFCGLSDFFLHPILEPGMGSKVAKFIFQLSFATTAITIVSGAMAERTNFKAYCVFTLFYFIIYCFPAGWVWRDGGWLKDLGALDYCGSCCVHMLGGISALVAAIKLKPRRGRFATNNNEAAQFPMANPANLIQGTFVLWWGFFVFNCGSTFGVQNGLWMLAARTFFVTFLASATGGMAAVFYSSLTLKYLDIGLIINGILAGMVAVCGCAAFLHEYDALHLGAVGGLLGCMTPKLLEKLKIDDPIGAVAVHGAAGLYGALAVGFVGLDTGDIPGPGGLSYDQRGLLYGGGFTLLGKQALMVLAVGSWTAIWTWALLSIIDVFIPIRMNVKEEILGADLWLHGIQYKDIDYDQLVEQIKRLGYDVDKRLRKVGCSADELSYYRKVIQSHINKAFVTDEEGRKHVSTISLTGDACVISHRL